MDNSVYFSDTEYATYPAWEASYLTAVQEYKEAVYADSYPENWLDRDTYFDDGYESNWVLSEEIDCD